MSDATKILATNIFGMAAYFAPDEEIRIGIFLSLASDRRQLKEAVEYLQRQSLVKVDSEDEKTFVISDANQARHREFLKRAGMDEIVLKRTISLLNGVSMKYYPHALSAYKYAEMHPELLKCLGPLPGRIVIGMSRSGKSEEANEFGKECYELLAKILGEYDETVLHLRMKMAQALMDSKKKEEAIEMLKVLYNHNIRSSDRNPLTHVFAMEMLAECFLKDNPDHAAEGQLRRILFHTRKISKSFRDFELRDWVLYAKSISEYEYFFNTAISIFEDVIRRRKRAFGSDDEGINEVVIEMAECLITRSRFQEAMEVLRNNYTGRKNKFGILSIPTVEIRFLMGKILKEQGDLEKSMSIFEEVAEKLKTAGEKQLYFKTINEISTTCILQKNFDRALKFSLDFYNGVVKDFGMVSPILFENRMITGESLLGLNQTKEALKIYRDLLDDHKSFGNGDKRLDQINLKIQLIKNMEFNAPEGTLHSFAKEGNLAEALSVIANGGDVDAKDANDKTPLLYATAFEKADVARVLIKQGAKHPTRLPSEFSPHRGSEMHTLLETVCSFFDAVKAGDNDKLIEVASTETCLFGARDDQGCTALHWAALRGHVSVLKVLLELGCDPSVVSDKGNSLLHIAASKGHVEIAEVVLQSTDKVAALLEGRTGSGGNTPLHAAAEKGHQGVVKALLVHGAVYCPVNVAGMTPIELCKDSKCRDLLVIIDRLFLGVSKGEVECVGRMLDDLDAEDVLAVSRATNEAQRTLFQVAMECKHLEIAKSLVKLLK